MDHKKLTSLACRTLFFIASLTLVLGFVEKLANVMDKTLTRSYSPERLLEITVALIMIVAVLLLRQIREELRTRGSRPELPR